MESWLKWFFSSVLSIFFFFVRYALPTKCSSFFTQVFDWSKYLMWFVFHKLRPEEEKKNSKNFPKCQHERNYNVIDETKHISIKYYIVIHEFNEHFAMQ